jgi:uncharacterized protein (UPF0335 family)
MTTTETVKELIEKLLTIENEVKLLNDDKKLILDDYKSRIDIKAFKAAVRIAKIKSRLGDSEDECDNILNVVEDRLTL